MIQYSWQLAKRFAVLVPGLLIAYLSVRDIFPYFDTRLPLVVAILFTYILGAYVLVPALIRLFRILVPPNHLPLYCITPDGFASDPLNIGLIGKRQEVIAAMERAGWHLADPHRGKYLLRHVLSTIFSRPYPNAPVSNLYLFGRKQDLAFEIPVKGGYAQRHHVRFWATTFDEKKRLSVHSIHWHHRREHVADDRLLWVGAASLDTGLAPIRHSLQITHMIHPDTNRERQLIVSQLEAAGLVRKVSNLRLDDPYRLVNRAWRGYLQTDGRMEVAELRPAYRHHSRHA